MMSTVWNVLTCQDMGLAVTGCDWLHSLPHIRAPFVPQMDSQTRQDHDGFVYLYSLVHIHPTVKGQRQNHLEQTLSPASRGSYKAGVQMPSGLMVFLPFDSMNSPGKCTLRECFRLG